jgi:hypothetical protein
VTTVRVPVRIRLDLTGGRLDRHLLDTVRDGVAAGTARAVDRARGVPALSQVVWSDEPPDVRVRFRGDVLPTWAAAHLETSAQAAVQAAATALRSGGAGAPAPVRTTRQLRRFASDDDLVDAVRDQLGAQPMTIVVAADGDGTGLMRFVERGPDGFLAVTRRITLNHWALPPDDKDAVKVSGYGGGWRADSLDFYADAPSPAIFRERLAAMWVHQWRLADPTVSEQVLLDKARRQAAKFKDVTGTLYELRDGGRPVRPYIGTPGLTRTSLPVLVLTEDVPVTSLDDQYGKNCPPLRYDPHAAANAHPNRPFLHEVALSDWDTETYAGFSDLITVVVVQLGLPWPTFAGSFILHTLAFIREVSSNLGGLETGGRQSVLKRMATAMDALNTLMFAYTKAVLARDRAKKLPCPLAGHAEEWATYLHHAYFPARRDTVASLFIAACQDALLAVLERSAADIAHRLASTDWLAATHAVLTSLLTNLPELTDMQTKLRQAKAHNETTTGFTDRSSLTYRHLEVEVVNTPVFPERRMAGPQPYRSAYRIRDAHGVWHRLEEVEAAVKSLRTEAFLTDPFLEKLADIPDVVARLRVAQRLDSISSAAGVAVTAGVDREFVAVLTEIQKLNEKHTAEARADRSVAYGLATFESDSRTEIHEKLSGVHRDADELLREMFRDKEIYDDGLTALAHQEISKRKFEEFFTFAGLTLLAVFFPEIAFVFGLAQAVEGVATAGEHAELQRSMFDGDSILSRAQVEAERTSAWIQGFLALAPELGPLARGASTGARALVKGELTEVTLAAFESKMREIVARLAEATLERLAVNFLVQAATGYVLNLALSEVIGELAESVADEYRPGGTVPRDQVRGHVRRAIGAAMSANGEAP